MKMLVRLAVVLSVLIRGTVFCSAQGFVNLTFERAGIFLPQTPPYTYGGEVDPALAFNGWTVTNALGPGHYPVYSLYNSLTLGSSAVDLVGPQFPNALNLTPLQGSYSVLLQGFANTDFVGLPGLLQSGTIFPDALSISFLTSPFANAGRLTVGGVDVPLFPIGGNRIAGDVSAFAGMNVELLISTIPGGGGFYFDDVRFSNLPVPEPSPCTLAALALLGFVLFRKRRFCK